jgi:ankyrin repeat protein
VVHPGVTADNWAYATAVPADINEKDGLGRTALWRAAFRGYADQVIELLEAGADASLPGPDGRTLLEHARQGALHDTYIGYLLQQAARVGPKIR